MMRYAVASQLVGKPKPFIAAQGIVAATATASLSIPLTNVLSETFVRPQLGDVFLLFIYCIGAAVSPATPTGFTSKISQIASTASNRPGVNICYKSYDPGADIGTVTSAATGVSNMSCHLYLIRGMYPDPTTFGTHITNSTIGTQSTGNVVGFLSASSSDTAVVGDMLHFYTCGTTGAVVYTDFPSALGLEAFVTLTSNAGLTTCVWPIGPVAYSALPDINTVNFTGTAAPSIKSTVFIKGMK